MSTSATKQESELRVAHAAELAAKRQAYSAINILIASRYGILRRRAKQITSKDCLLLKMILEKGT